MSETLSPVPPPAVEFGSPGLRGTDARRQELVDTAKAWGYFGGAIKSRKDLWKGRRILDIGMGAGPHAVSFIEGGCAAYVGVDPLVGSEHVRDFRNLKDPSVPPYHAFPFPTAEIMDIYPNVHLYAGFLEDVTDQIRRHHCDMAMLAAVTEHLSDSLAVFRGIWEALTPGALLWFSHCNYFSWTGHHAPPRSTRELDLNNPAHLENVDWKHLEPTNQHYQNPNFNRIRLDDLRDIVDTYFEIVEWKVSVEALERLTPEIREKWKKYTLAELLGQNIYCTGRRRDTPLTTDFTGRQFHHPDEAYRADADYTHEPMGAYDIANSVYLQPNGVICSHSDNRTAGARLFARVRPGDRVVLKKFVTSLSFTVTEIIRMPTGELRLKVAEPIGPETLRENYDQWTIVAHDWSNAR